MDDICQVRGTVINQHWNRLQICAAGQTGPNTPIFIPFRPMLRKKMYQHWKQNTETMPNCESFYCSNWLKLNDGMNHESFQHTTFLNIPTIIGKSLLFNHCSINLLLNYLNLMQKNRKLAMLFLDKNQAFWFWFIN